MKITTNTFRDALKAGRPQIGCWVGFASADVAEALAGCGFDWLLFDGEQAPHEPRSVLQQLRAVAPHTTTHAVVRAVETNVALIRQHLDVGAQTLLIPMVDTAEQAALMVQAMRHRPEGIRAMGAARASRWNRIDDYIHQANAQMCLLVQAETAQAVRNLKSIAQTDGVDGVFFGPADLAASMGYRGQPAHPEVHKTILDGIATVRAAGKAPGVLTTHPVLAQQYLKAGALFVAVGLDTSLLTTAASDLARRFSAFAPDMQRLSMGY